MKVIFDFYVLGMDRYDMKYVFLVNLQEIYLLIRFEYIFIYIYVIKILFMKVIYCLIGMVILIFCGKQVFLNGFEMFVLFKNVLVVEKMNEFDQRIVFDLLIFFEKVVLVFWYIDFCLEYYLFNVDQLVFLLWVCIVLFDIYLNGEG